MRYNKKEFDGEWEEKMNLEREQREQENFLAAWVEFEKRQHKKKISN